MAFNLVQAPQFAGADEVAKAASNHLGLQGFQKPIWDTMMWKQSHAWWFSPYVVSISGEKEPIGANEWNWVEDGKWYRQQNIVSAVDNGGGSYELTLSETKPYFIVNDVIDLGQAHPTQNFINILARVTAIDSTGATEKVTVTVIDPNGTVGAIAVADLAGNDTTLLYNTQGECFQLPEGRVHTPNQYTNKLNKIVNTHKQCDDASNREYWFKSDVTGRFYWMDEDEHLTMYRHRMQCDMALLFGQMHSFTEPTTNYEGVGGDGLIPILRNRGFIGSYAGTVLEDDLIEMMTKIRRYSSTGGVNRFDVLCGDDYMKDVMIAMRPYFIGGGVHYGNFSGNGVNRIGINFQEYQFGNTILRFMQYDGFSDPNFLPQGANGVDYAGMGVWLNLERGGIKVVYKKRRQGGKIKDWLNYKEGATFAADGAAITDDRACRTIVYTTHIGLELKGANDHGIHFKV